MTKFNLGETPDVPPQNSNPKKPLKVSAPEVNRLPDMTDVQPPSNPETQIPLSSGTSESSALPDFDGAPIPDDEITPAAPVGEGMVGKLTPSGFITYEIFDSGFCKAFMLAGHMTGFQTLVHAPEQPARADATRAMYDIILDTPSLHFLLNPSSLWMQRALAMGMFFVPVAAGVAAEMQQRQKKPVTAAQSEPHKAASDPTADMRASLKGKKAN